MFGQEKPFLPGKISLFRLIEISSSSLLEHYFQKIDHLIQNNFLESSHRDALLLMRDSQGASALYYAILSNNVELLNIFLQEIYNIKTSSADRFDFIRAMLQNSMEREKIRSFVDWCEKHFAACNGQINLFINDETAKDFEILLRNIKPDVAQEDEEDAQAKPISPTLTPVAEKSTWDQLANCDLNLNKLFLPVSVIATQIDEHNQPAQAYSRKTFSPARS